MTNPPEAWPSWFGLWNDAASYMVDRWQRGVLMLDVLRQRGNQYHAWMRQEAPTVLHFEAEMVLDGRTLPRPVNYSLTRVVPPEGTRIDPRKRPFVVVDPRAGHGPGIGGFKPDSEVGAALRAGHTCYFIGFLPRPVHGQTVEDVMDAEAAFLERVIAMHPMAEGKPVVIGNCQAGWQLMMTAATRPELFGPIVIAGAPLSYWAGWRGKNPMRYSGGLLGGTWMTAFASDLGAGLFDGTWLVENFENLNPANTLWTKQYNLFSKIDTETPRYLEFEKWWAGHVLLNAAEIQYITDNLFVGNKLATAELVTKRGTRIDLRNIKSPIIVFCSRGDNITPPPQALGWITDLYKDVNDIRAHGQTIVYALHDSIGHLGIFVSGSVARKEHEEFASNIDFIDVLPPGLYETEITPRTGEEVNPELLDGNYVLRFGRRSIDEVEAIVEPREDDEKRFAAAARLSNVNLAIYRTLFQPFVRAMVSEPVAEWIRRMHPLRVQYDMFSDRNPFVAAMAPLAEAVRADRRPAAPDNPFVTLEGNFSQRVEEALDRYRDLRDEMAEKTFLGFYGLPVLQALVGLGPEADPPRRRPGDEPEHRAFIANRVAELRARMAEGGPREAELRALLYAQLAERTTDERSFTMLRRMQEEEGSDISLAAFKQTLRDQLLMLLIDHEAALTALPKLLNGASAEEIERRLAAVHRIATAAGDLGERSQARLNAVERIFREAAAKAGSGVSAAEAAPAAAEVAASAPDMHPAPHAAGEAPERLPPAAQAERRPPPSRRRRDETPLH
ncbi:DUF3141 domain-containing protein [Roseomonas sp. NAR14]|uniref:DUF3141 domain-containing protein n=1 Tax=Roseomonas acroporae TaxID=2937791 RepID=A0A9X2BV15_9PROT|nr:DUF3141 domain-containing protein [Roseomonas acroporae]MCK8784586.1 DUF3141 domain-containing protein [Roseomonas acroporae]